MRPVLYAHFAGVKKRRNGVPANPGVKGSPRGSASPLGTPSTPRTACRGGKQYRTGTTGSGVPASLANLAPLRRGETDRNTDPTDPTPVVPQETEPPRT